MAAGYSRARAWRRKLVYVALVSALVTAGTLIGASAADARITRIQIMTTESPTFGSYSWPGVGRYEKIVGKAFGEVDPADPLNTVIVDLELAPRNARGDPGSTTDVAVLANS